MRLAALAETARRVVPRRLGAALGLLTLLAAPPPVWGWGETAFRASPQEATATCLRDAGPGSLALLGPLRRHSTPIDLLTVTPTTLTERSRVDLGAIGQCPEVATAGFRETAIAAVTIGRRFRSEVRAAIVGASRPAVPPTTLGKGSQTTSTSLAVAASPAGDALVAWSQSRRVTENSPGQVRVVAARRYPGGLFGPLEQVSGWRSVGQYGAVDLAAAVDPSGRATIAVRLQRPDRGRIPNLSTITVASAERSGRFTIQLLTRSAQDAGLPVVLSAADGATLLVHDANGGIWVYDRAPGAPRFARRKIFFDRDLEFAEPAAALRPGGGAVVAWRAGESSTAGIRAALRERTGSFKRPVVVSRREAQSNGAGLFVGGADSAFAPLDQDNLRLRAALTASGHTVISWGSPRQLPYGDHPLAARAAPGSLASGFSHPRTLGCPCRATNGVAPLLLPGVGPVVAWTDNSSDFRFGAEFAGASGRLHLALPALPRPTPPAAPRLRLTARHGQSLRWGQPVSLVASCDRACDLRGLIRGRTREPFLFSGNAIVGLGTAFLPTSGRVRLAVAPDANGQLAPPRAGRVRVVVRAFALNSEVATTRSIRVLVRRHPVPPVPAPRDVRARRHGRFVNVSWHLDRPTRGVGFFVESRDRPHHSLNAERFSAFIFGRGFDRRRSFRAVLRLRRNDPVRFVAVTVERLNPPQRRKTVIVPVE